MSSSDKEFCYYLCCVIGIIGLIVGGALYLTNRRVSVADDLTARYAMPPELAGSRVYRLAPKGHGQILYVVVDGNGPAVTSFDAGGGKNQQRAEVVTP